MKIMTRKLGTAAVLLAAIAMAQADFAPETRLSDNTLAVLTVRNFARDCEQFQQTPMGLLLKDPSMKPFCDGMTECFKNFKAQRFDEKFDPDNYKGFFTGGAALTATLPYLNWESDGEISNLGAIPIFMAEVSKDEKTLSDTMERLKGDLNASSVRPIGGTKFYFVEKEDAAIIFGAKDGLFLMTYANEDEIKMVEKEIESIITAKRSGSTLADSATFKANTVIKADRDYFFLNFVPVMTKIKDYVKVLDSQYQAPSDPMEAMMASPAPMAIFNALGLSALKSLSVSAFSENGNICSEGQIICPKGERRGITDLFNGFPAADLTTSDKIPAKIMSYQRTHFLPDTLWKTVDKTTTDTMGGIKSVLQGMISAQLAKQEGIDLRKNILQNLTGDVISIQLEPTTESNGSLTKHSLFLFEANDAEACLKNITRSAEAFGSAMETEKIGDKEVYTFSVPAFGILEDDDEDGEGMVSLSEDEEITSSEEDDEDEEEIHEIVSTKSSTLYLTYEKNSLIVADSKTAVSAAIKIVSGKASEPMTATVGLSDAVAKVGGYKQSIFCFSNLKVTGDMVIKFLKSDAGANFLMDKDTVLAVSKLPDFKKIEKYFGIMTSATTVDDNGLSWKSYAPVPAELKK